MRARPKKNEGQTLDLIWGRGEDGDGPEVGNFPSGREKQHGGGDLWARGPRPWACRAGTPVRLQAGHGWGSSAWTAYFGHSVSSFPGGADIYFYSENRDWTADSR
jgi:hypothetical protein